jgi:hypothetical protein
MVPVTEDMIYFRHEFRMALAAMKQGYLMSSG